VSRGNSLSHLVARDVGRRLSDDVQSSVLLHLSAHSLEHAAMSASRVQAVPAAAEALASATSPSSVASGYTRDAAFSVDGSTIADEGRSCQSRVHLSMNPALLPSNNDSSWPLTFGETSRVSVSQRSARQLQEQRMSGAQQQHHHHHQQQQQQHHQQQQQRFQQQQQQQQQQPVSATALASSSRHRILGEIEGLIRTLKGGGGGA
jgi:ABC-type nickel/cobalt efflux system permease component RcnA